MGDLFKPVTQWISANVGWTVLLGLFVLSLFFEFSKIKLSPITAFLKWIGDRLLGGVRKDIADLKESTDKRFDEMKAETDQNLNALKDSVNEAMAELTAKSNYNDAEFQRKLDDIETKQDTQLVTETKRHVLNFARQCRHGESHTLEDFRNLILENQAYEKIIEKRNWENDVYKSDFAFIMADYNRRLETDDFLK